MKAYTSYFDRQQPSPGLHKRLLALETTHAKRRAQGGDVMKFGALAACLALLFGVGSWLGLGSVPGPAVPPGPYAPAANVKPTEPPKEKLDTSLTGDRSAFVVQGPEEDVRFRPPPLSPVDYADATGKPTLAASLALSPGSFSNPLSKEEIQTIFWGPEGRPADAGKADLPLFLSDWQGYLLCADAMYDGDGALWMVSLRGVKGEETFTLKLSPGQIPVDCVVIQGLEPTDVLGTQVTGWRQSYDRDGDGETEHVVSSKFLVNGVGVVFENVGAVSLEEAQAFNLDLVNLFCRAEFHPYLGHLLTCEDIPEWKYEIYDTLDSARAGAEGFARAHPELDFLPHLPTQGPKGYGEFNGVLSYQAGSHARLFVRWVKGYDDVEVEVNLPVGRSTSWHEDALVDVTVPESYDWRLYDIPICDNVPKEYQLHFYKPVFRAEDMSLEVVKARMVRRDTGGEGCEFCVLHEDGAVVGYSCAGVSPEYVWGLVAETLS